jgi:hypothetical protein
MNVEMRLLPARRPKVSEPLENSRVDGSVAMSFFVVGAELRTWPSEEAASSAGGLLNVAVTDIGREELLVCPTEPRPSDNDGACSDAFEVFLFSLSRSRISRPSSLAFLTSSRASFETNGAASTAELIRIEAGESDTSTLVALNTARTEGDGVVGRYSCLRDEATECIDCASAGGMKSNIVPSRGITPDRDCALTGCKNGGLDDCIEVDDRALETEPPRALGVEGGGLAGPILVTAGEVTREPTRILRTE